MLKLVLGVALGIIFCLLGLYFAYIFIDNSRTGVSPELLIPTVLLLAGGIYCCQQVILGYLKGKEPVDLELDFVKQGQTSELLERNNQIAEEWKRTADTKDQLKLLKVAAAANAEK